MDRKTELEVLIERFRGTELDGLDTLISLAIDLSYTGDHLAERIWSKLHPSLWEQTQSPWVILKTVSLERLKEFLSESDTKENLQRIQSEKQQGRSWFEEKYPQSPLKHVVYFCMEFMLSESLPIYSGGLGNVAGDQLKAANDLGIPVTGVGLLYQQGYFRQVILQDGTQQALYPYNDPDQLPIVPFRKKNGEWLRLQVDLPGYSLWLRVWEARVGKVRLLLLDSNDAANYPAHRSITSELYGGGKELRLQQEMILGICGWRLLEEVGIEPEVCHLNEGHSAFAILERAKSLMNKEGINFWEALAITRAGNVFTTHTAVAAGFDLFDPALMARYLSNYASGLGISFKEFMGLGRLNPSDANEPFNMAYLSIKGSGAVNAVSRLHGEVSRNLFQSLYPRWPQVEVPVGHVTNGVHMRSWQSEAAEELWKQVCGPNPWSGSNEETAAGIENIPDEQLWNLRNQSRKTFIESFRRRRPSNLAAAGASQELIAHARTLFNPEALTIGFARRFATYKRPNLLLYNKERLLGIFKNAERPVQLVIAGKAHPADQQGQAMIREWVEFSRRKEVRDHIVFLSDYDMNLARRMVQGVDVWLNNPRRPWEASGTSGMKVLVNGGLNLSELDGWWAEAYDPAVGWAIGDGKEHSDDALLDIKEAEQLYQILENEVVPAFYERDEQGIPRKWVQLIKQSMAQLTPQFSVSRTTIEYTEKYYLPAALALQSRIPQRELAASQKRLREGWRSLSIEDVRVEEEGKGHRITAAVHLSPLHPQEVEVELFADGIDSPIPTIVTMEQVNATNGKDAPVIYQAMVNGKRDPSDFTVRIIPKIQGLNVPLENNLILWQR
jgi:starch phosphorylase